MNFILPNIIFTILTTILGCYVTFLTTKGGLTDNRRTRSGIFYTITKRGRYVLISSILGLIIFYLQEQNTQNISKSNEAAFKRETARRDSIITVRVKSSVDLSQTRLFENLSKSFATQGLKIDTLNKEIKITKIAIKSQNISVIKNNPVLFVSEIKKIDSLEKGHIRGSYKITFSSLDDGSKNYKIVAYILTQKKDGVFDNLSTINFFPKNLTLSRNAKWTSGFEGKYLKEISKMYIYVKGSYTDLNDTRKIQIDDLYEYDVNTSFVSIPLNKQRIEIIRVINSIPKKLLILE